MSDTGKAGKKFTQEFMEIFRLIDMITRARYADRIQIPGARLSADGYETDFATDPDVPAPEGVSSHAYLTAKKLISKNRGRDLHQRLMDSLSAILPGISSGSLEIVIRNYGWGIRLRADSHLIEVDADTTDPAAACRLLTMTLFKYRKNHLLTAQ